MLVAALVASVFFQRLDYVLWQKHGFPVPDITFVLVGIVVIGWAFVLLRRGELALSPPGRLEIVLLGLLVILAASSAITAAIAGFQGPSPTKYAQVSMIGSQSLPPTSVWSSHLRIKREPNGHGGELLVLPQARQQGTLNIRDSDGAPFGIKKGNRYMFSLRLRAASRETTVRLYMVERPNQSSTGPLSHGIQATVLPTRWTRATVTATGAKGMHTADFVIRFSSARSPTPVYISNVQLDEGVPRPATGLSAHVGQSIKTWLHVCFLVLIALLIGRMLTPPRLLRALVVFFILSAFTAFVAVLQALDQNVVHSGASSALHLVSRRTGSFVRPCSTFSEPAYLGYFSLLGLVVGLWLSSNIRSLWLRLGLVLCVLGVLLAAAAGPVVALIPVSLYVFWRAAPMLRRIWPSLAAVAIVGIGVLAFLPSGSTLANRASQILSGSDQSAQFRYAVDSASIKIWEIQPLTGVGLGNTRYYIGPLVHLSFMPNATLSFQSVDAYLGVLSEAGIVGLLALVITLVLLLMPARGSDRGDWVTEAPILVFIVAFIFIGGFVTPVFWFWVGLRLAHLGASQPRAVADRHEPEITVQPAVAS